MPRIQFVAKLAVDRDTGLPLPSLAGQAVQIVKRGTSTPVTIWENEAGTLVIPSSQRTVTSHLFVPSFWVMDTDLPVSALGGGVEVPLESAEGIAKRLDSLEPALVAASTAAVDTATSVATFQKWIELGITRRNLITNPRLTGRAFTLSGGTGTQTDVLTGGPLGFGYRRVVMATTTTTSPISISASGSGTASVPVVEGRTYTFSAYAQMIGGSTSPATNGGVSVSWFDAAGASLSADSSYQGALVNGVWTRHSKTLVAPAGAAYAQITERFSVAAGSVPVGSEYGATGFMVEDSATLGDYADGSLPSTQYRANRWSGAPGASVSEQLDMTPITDQQLPAGGTMGQALVKLSNADRDVAWGTVAGGSGGVSVHGLLSGLDQDDHTQYLNNARGDSRYYTKSQVDTIATAAGTSASAADRARGNHTGTQPIGTISGLQDILDSLGGSGVNSVAGKTGVVTLVAADISNSGTVGRALMVAADQVAARTAIGAAATSHTHSASQITDSSSVGRSVLTASDAAAARTAIGAGTSGLALGTTSTTAMRGDAIQLNPSTITGLPVGTLIARTA